LFVAHVAHDDTDPVELDRDDGCLTGRCQELRCRRQAERAAFFVRDEGEAAGGQAAERESPRRVRRDRFARPGPDSVTRAFGIGV
jgi:hypothetical protein